MLVMPIQLLRRRPESRITGQQNCLALQGVILLAVIEFVLEATADLNVEVRRDGEVATVEQRMDILSQQQSVAWVVTPTVSIGSNVGSIEHMQHMGIGEGALTLIDICHDAPE